jgi:hypothetical protein
MEQEAERLFAHWRNLPLRRWDRSLPRGLRQEFRHNLDHQLPKVLGAGPQGAVAREMRQLANEAKLVAMRALVPRLRRAYESSAPIPDGAVPTPAKASSGALVGGVALLAE